MATGFSVFVNIGGKVAPSLGAAIRAVDSQFVGLANRLKNIGANVDRPFRQIEAGLKRHQKRMGKLQDKGVGLTAGITAPTGLVAKRGFDTILGFEKEVNKAQAYGELDGDSRNQIEAMARRIGRDTQFTAQQAAMMARTYIQAGRDLKQTLGMVEPTLDFAKFGDVDPAKAADVITSVTSAYRVPLETIEQAQNAARKVGDIIAKGANISRADVNDFGMAFKYAAPVAARLGVSMEQLGAAVATMNQNGLRGDEAGVAVRSMLTRMVKPTLGARAAMASLNMEFEDFATRFQKVDPTGFAASLDQRGIPANKVLGTLKKRLAGKELNAENHGEIAKILRDTVINGLGITKPKDQQVVANAVSNYISSLVDQIDFDKLQKQLSEKGATAGQIAQIFDQRQGARIGTLLGQMEFDATDKDGNVQKVKLKPSQYQDFYKTLVNEAPGSSARGARLMEQGLPGAVDRFSSALENMTITIFKSGVLEDIINLLERMQKAINDLAETDPGKLKLATYLVAAAAAAGPLLFVLGSLGKVAILASRGIVLLARGLVFLATALTTGLAARVMLLSRSLVALSVAASASLAARLRTIGTALALLAVPGGGRLVLGAIGASLLAFGKSVLMFPIVALRAIGVAMRFLVANPIGLAITAIVTALAALGTWVYNNWSGIKQFFTSFGEGFSKALGPQATAALSTLNGYLQQAWEWMSKLLGPLDESGAKWKTWGEAAGAAAAAMVNALAELPGKISAAVSAAGQAAYAAVMAINWSGLGGQIIDGIVSGVTSAAGRLASAVGNAARAAWAGARSAIGSIGSGFSRMGSPTPGGGTATPIPGRYRGGPVTGGSPYIVGEKGPELFVPGASGSIATNDVYRSLAGAVKPTAWPSLGRTQAAAAGQGGKSVSITHGDTHVSVRVDGGSQADGNNIARVVREELRKILAGLEADQRTLLSD